MNSFNYKIAKKNINILLKEKNITQNELAEYLNMSQGNVSKALKIQESKFFTVEQIFNIAEYLEISIDELLGRNTDNDCKSAKEICKDIVNIFRTSGIEAKKVMITEEKFMYDEAYDGFFSLGEGESEYNVLYFPLDYKTKIKGQYGNNKNFYEQNVLVNNFLEKFLQIEKIYKESHFPEDVFKLIVDNYLENETVEIPF